MAAGERLTIQMSGGSPWGFRLYGGDDDPLVVAKLRKRSKAHDAGLMEGDALLGINGYSCQGITHGTAMSLIESAPDLKLIVLRGASGKDAVNDAIQALGSELQPVTSAVKAASQAAAASNVRLSPAPATVSLQQASNQNQHQVVNGYSAPEPYSRQEQTFTEGDKTTHVITETSREQFGNTTLTKIKRETVTQFGQKPMFNVSNVASGIQSSATQKPGVWTPSGGSKLTVSAPSGVQVQHNPDQSITMTIGLHGGGGTMEESKENIAPPQSKLGMPPMFKVSKFGSKPEEQKPKPAIWTPSGGPPVQPTKAPSPQPETGTSTMDDELTLLPDEEAELKAHLESLKKPLPSLLQKVLVDGSGSDREGTPDSPGYLSRRRIEQFASEYETEEERHKRKMFADSAFYDDPEHKYPTIEEQVKMARKVAMSLLAPANKKARGHRMFMRRMVKSQKWTTGDDRTEKDFEWDNDEEEEKYYNPNPWSAASTKWEPPKPTDTGPKKIPPPPPPVPTNLLQSPTIPFGAKKDKDKTKALSAEEFEKMRLFEAKTDHTQVSPALCFSLAEDLRNMKGKGGKLFAKRVARAEKWVVDDNPSPSKPNPDLIRKIAMQAAAGGAMPMPGMGPAEPAAPSAAKPALKQEDSGPVVNRLKDMIDPPKPKMTPWEAAATNDGNVEKAFDHLKGYNPYGRSMTGELASNLETATQKSTFTAPSTVAPPVVNASEQSAPKMPDYMRKIKPWNPSEQGSSAAGAAYSSPAAAARPTQAATSSGSGFRPVSFRPPIGGATSGGTSGGEAASSGGGEEMGFCDL